MKKTNELVNVDGCVVKDERGVPVASLSENTYGRVHVEKLTACSVGTYMYILGYLRDLGFELDSE